MEHTNSERRWTQGDSAHTPVRVDWGQRPFCWPPGQTNPRWREVLEHRPDLAPAVKPEVRRVVDGMARGLARDARLKILGNGVVPQQAALAWRLLN